ncbi:hypothetical protein GPECTOR_7g934 [Gonium pectorale]|uniref:PsbP C-terminal domain-containing protein n=1 Tax=Gonium pectorale TaxID=33097 RepID=A0A150GUL6_GONPE|nr:hypothetical protein GPECTOR_7g934 [Gonium pectorale]|eukprot:KXZ53484.1 hypothetical protein GPECTOR_7g934 [Gonium pectorale]
MALATKLSTKQATLARTAPVAVPRGRILAVHASASSQQAASVPDVAQPGRREMLLSVAGLGLAMCAPVSPVKADGEYATFLGYATPPTSYGGYGGNAKESPRYTFEYPSGWKEDQPNKVEKGTQGIDGRVVNPRSKDQRAFVITLARAGEDNKSFRLTDLDSTLSGFAGADYDLQDALSSATKRETSSREVGGYTFYDYDIESPSFAANEVKLRNIITTFKLL